MSVAAGVADEERRMLDSLGPSTTRRQRGHKSHQMTCSAYGVFTHGACLGTDGGTEWRCQMASLRQATRLAGECPDPQQIGRESLDVEE